MDEGIIESVQFADWAVPIVPVVKQDKVSVRICGDFKLFLLIRDSNDNRGPMQSQSYA